MAGKHHLSRLLGPLKGIRVKGATGGELWREPLQRAPCSGPPLMEPVDHPWRVSPEELVVDIFWETPLVEPSDLNPLERTLGGHAPAGTPWRGRLGSDLM
jgi:hypothetical protein